MHLYRCSCVVGLCEHVRGHCVKSIFTVSSAQKTWKDVIIPVILPEGDQLMAHLNFEGAYP